jgi:murein DD-endopeptidase MepM/ murein hydrolase activator NlpD
MSHHGVQPMATTRSDRTHAILAVLLLSLLALTKAQAAQRLPLFRSLDLGIGEAARVELDKDHSVGIRLVSVDVTTDPIRGAVRSARVGIEVDGKPFAIHSGNYELPRTVGPVQVDCPVVAAYRTNTNEDHWALEKAARIRVWPAGSPWIEPDSFVSPVRQRWLAGLTQMGNEPTYVDAGEDPKDKKIYYHAGLDIGGAEGMSEIVAATDGLVVSRGNEYLPGHDPKTTPVRPRYDVVYLRDDRGWYYRYSHMQTIDPAMRPGAEVKRGQRLGVLGKEGGSGGWSHQHFEIKSRQPSGKWGTEEGYAFLWQAALRDFQPEVVAVARPHVLARVGDRVVLYGGKSWCRSGAPARFDWIFSDGSTASSPRVEKTYDHPGTYSEILKVTDAQGRSAFDFAHVEIVDPARLDDLPPTIHAAFAPTMGLHAGDLVTFKVRTFRTTEGEETWDFGDGSPHVAVRSDGNINMHAPDGYAVTIHRYARPGDYLVRVERANRRVWKATAWLHVHVD